MRACGEFSNVAAEHHDVGDAPLPHDPRRSRLRAAATARGRVVSWEEPSGWTGADGAVTPVGSGRRGADPRPCRIRPRAATPGARRQPAGRAPPPGAPRPGGGRTGWPRAGRSRSGGTQCGVRSGRGTSRRGVPRVRSLRRPRAGPGGSSRSVHYGQRCVLCPFKSIVRWAGKAWIIHLSKVSSPATTRRRGPSEEPAVRSRSEMGPTGSGQSISRSGSSWGDGEVLAGRVRAVDAVTDVGHLAESLEAVQETWRVRRGGGSPRRRDGSTRPCRTSGSRGERRRGRRARRAVRRPHQLGLAGAAAAVQSANGAPYRAGLAVLGQRTHVDAVRGTGRRVEGAGEQPPLIAVRGGSRTAGRR